MRTSETRSIRVIPVWLTYSPLTCGFDSHWEYLLVSLVKAQTWARLYGEVRYTCDKGHEHPDDAAPIELGKDQGSDSHMSQRNFNDWLEEAEVWTPPETWGKSPERGNKTSIPLP